jgi:transposase, IS6 family
VVHTAHRSILAILAVLPGPNLKKLATETGEQSGPLQSPYLNNIIEQDHRFIKKRIVASLGFRSAEGAWRTIDGYEAMHVIRKGQIRWLAKGDVVGQRQFIHALFGIAA